ncbi:MAG: HNH endonuclease signature motif containing protein, partial [Clostridia bacterium]
MNYKYHYDKLIQTRKLLNRKKLNKDNQNYAYYEKHHIIMSSMGGTDNKENLILLTAREHFLAHWLLWRIYRNKQTAYAFFRLCSYNNENGGKPILSSRVYEEAKIAAAVYSSEQFKNLWKNKEKRKKMSKENSIKNKGRKHSLESRKNMSISRTGMHQSKETIDKRVKAITGKKRSEEQKMRMKKAQSHRKETTEETKQKQSNS